MLKYDMLVWGVKMLPAGNHIGKVKFGLTLDVALKALVK